MIRAYKIFSIAIAFLFIFPTLSLAGQFKVTHVYDGDTLIAEGHDIEIKVRLAGIDASELPVWEPYAAKAKTYLAEMVLNKTVDIRGYGLGPVNRVVGVISINGKDINLEMVRAGLAVAFRGRAPKGFDPTPYIEAETEAKQARRGMWSLEV
jgi:micrococcal nuclease